MAGGVEQPSAAASHQVPFSRYEHRLLTAQDVMVFSMMPMLLGPGDVTSSVCCLGTHLRRPRIRRLAIDMQVLRKTLFTISPDGGEQRPPWDYCWLSSGPSPAVADVLLDLIRRHHFETQDPCIRQWVEATVPSLDIIRNTKSGADKSCAMALRQAMNATDKLLDPDETERLRSLRARVDRMQSGRRLYDGGAFLPVLRQALERGFREPCARDRYIYGAKPVELPLWLGRDVSMNCMLQPAYADRASIGGIFLLTQLLRMDIHGLPGRGRPSTRSRVVGRRSKSESRGSDFATADLPPRDGPSDLQIVFPKVSLAQLYRQSRSRSLSPSRIDHMRVRPFHKGCESAETVPSALTRGTGMSASKCGFMKLHNLQLCPMCGLRHGSSGEKKPSGACQNCADHTHRTSECLTRCGFCGAPNPLLPHGVRSTAVRGTHANPHTAPNCPVAKKNRCKCVAFPQLHVADKCPILCSRDCGSTHAAGSFKHRNAMTCRSRCCMCGLAGHSGKECRLQSCRCGKKHLGQDCSWNPACRVPGCSRYLCGVHCRRCGTAEKPFVRFRCQKCLASP